ncbi:EAL domain-containing protein [Rhizobiaceae bacterium n13]|uniref:EAL domain-containing protein n=2 Tax=Ferirhizobium litorale TaxID=2927786 RepID=A0AAE3QBW9_9HYPH|nr:EAL domain-containing protein [Fererhizobium litorale]MDI7922957.1 EAL domain-containing protein [Fererhizobium litorale]
MAMVSMDDHMVLANSAFRRTLGYGEAVEFPPFDKLIDPDHLLEAASLLKSVREGHEEARRIRLRLTRADGHPLPVLAGIALADEELGPGYIVQIIEIAEFSKAIEDLQARESRWNHALVGSSLGVWDHNFRQGHLYYSDQWRAIRGADPGEEIDATFDVWIQKVHPDDRDHVQEAIARQNAGDPEYAAFEYRERHKDGHWIWIECRGACVERNADGTPARVIGTDTDITERKAAEEMLADVSRRLELALEISQIGVFEVDLESNVVEWDERLRAIYGMAGAERIRPSGLWESMLHPDDAQEVQSRIKDHLDRGSGFTNEYRIIRPDGSVRHIRARAAPFTDATGRPKLIGANWDVTSDIALQLELERSKTLAEARNRELEVAKARIEHNALHDYLTGLPNRRYLDEVLEKRAQECMREGYGLALLHIDLDRFKQINDTLGHKAGDTMLKHAAKTLLTNIRKDDFVARIGGDEFVLVSRLETPQDNIARLADRIIAELCKPVKYEGHLSRIGASIGIASAFGAIDGKELLLNADIALYRAKSSGRNRHEFFSRDTQNQIINTKRVSDEILHGLEQDEFAPVYQLQFCARTMEIAGVETLARWIHPTRGVLTPDTFLSIAEDLDVVDTIDGIILKKALHDFDRWASAGVEIPRISVNVSSRRLYDPALIQKINALDFKPGMLSFELLESIFLDDRDDLVMANLEHLRGRGINIEIDDFGTGHASIVSLLQIAPQTLKIDRELVRDIPQSAEKRKLVSAIIEMGKSLDIKVVAEGVETVDHIRILREIGCDILQGYALARPMPFDKIAGFVRSGSWRQLESPAHELQQSLKKIVTQ